MANPLPLNAAQIDSLLRSLAQEVHCDPQELRQQLQNGNLSSLSRSMSSSDTQQLQQLLKNPIQLQKAMNSPEMKELLRRIQGHSS